jgi:Tat protein translocase TatB subunit
MFGIGMQELLVIFVIALLVLGPKRLPEIARALGRGVREFRKATAEIKESVDLEGHLREIEEEIINEDLSLEKKNESKKKIEEKRSEEEKRV